MAEIIMNGLSKPFRLKIITNELSKAFWLKKKIKIIVKINRFKHVCLFLDAQKI